MKSLIVLVHQISVQPACITCHSFTKMESTTRNFTIPSSLKLSGIKMKHMLLPKPSTLKFILGELKSYKTPNTN